MTQLSQSDRNLLQNLQNGAGLAFTSHALAPGMSESTTDSAHTKAIAYLQNLQSSGAPEVAAYSAVLTDAIAHLQARQAHLRNPIGSGPPADR